MNPGSGRMSGDIPEELADKRRRMLERDLAGRGIDDPAVLDAMGRVPRHEFVPAAQRFAAYDDTPLRIGGGQTISQPYIVALMTQRLRVAPGMKVLEVGTGSGYQAAVLVAMGAEVYTVERNEDLSDAAEAAVDRAGFGDRVTLRVDDGTLGWPEEAPFDRVVVTAAGPRIPETLVRQLADGGILVMPVGGERDSQKLYVVEKRGEDAEVDAVLDVLFVPLVGKEGFGGGEKTRRKSRLRT